MEGFEKEVRDRFFLFKLGSGCGVLGHCGEELIHGRASFKRNNLYIAPSSFYFSFEMLVIVARYLF